MKKLIAFAVLCSACFAQSAAKHTFPALDTNNAFTGINSFSQGVVLGPSVFALLPGGAANGTAIFISDGTPGTPCTGGGSGALAVRNAGVWNCAQINGTGGGGGGGTPPGSPSFSIQYNNSSVFGGITSWSSNGTTSITGNATAALNLGAMSSANITFPTAMASGFLRVATGTGSIGTAELSGDCSTILWAITCPKTGGVLFAASATTDTTNASNISSGTLPAGREPALTGAVTTSAGSIATSPGKNDVLNSNDHCSAAGANTTTYTCNLSPAITSYVTGTHYRFKSDVANTAASSINFNSIGQVTIKKATGGITTDLSANDLRAGQWNDLVYDGANMQMQSTLGNNPAGSGTVNSGTINHTAYYAASAATVSSDPTMTDDGTTGTYTGTGGWTVSAGPLTVGPPSGGVGSRWFFTQEGTVPGSFATAGQDNVYADSTQHGLLASFNGGSTLPLVQGPVSSTNLHVAGFSGTNGGKLTDLGTTIDVLNPSSIGKAVSGFSPMCFVDGTVHATIASCISFLNGLGVTGTGVIWSGIPEILNGTEFASGSPRFSGTLFLNNDFGTATTNTYAQSGGSLQAWITNGPIVLPSRFRIVGVGAATQNATGGINSGTGIGFGSSFPTPIGGITTGNLGTPTCADAPGTGTLSDGTYSLVATLINNLMGGSTTPKTPGRGLTSTNKGGVVCNAHTSTQQITWAISNAPAVGTGYAAQEMAVYAICTATCTPLGVTGQEIEVGVAPGVSTGATTCSSSAGTVDIDGGACRLPNSLGTLTFTINFLDNKNPTAPKAGADLSNPLIVLGQGPDTGSAFSVSLENLSILGSPTNSPVPLANEPVVGILGYTAQEQSGTYNVTCAGAFTLTCAYVGFNSNNSSWIHFNSGSSNGPNQGNFYSAIFDGSMPTGGTARVIEDGTYAGHCNNCQFERTTAGLGFNLQGAVSSGGTTQYTCTANPCSGIGPQGTGNAFVGFHVTVTAMTTGTNNVVNQVITASDINHFSVATTSQTGTESGASGVGTNIDQVVNPAQILITGEKAYPSLMGVSVEAAGGVGIQVTNGASANLFQNGFAASSGGHAMLQIDSTAGKVKAMVHDVTGSAKLLIEDDSIAAGTGNACGGNCYQKTGTGYGTEVYDTGLLQNVSPHVFSGPIQCADTSASATTYTCTTSTAFVPASGDLILFTGINQANSGSSTLSVNGATARTIKKLQRGANLVANDLSAGGQVLLSYDATNTVWQMQGNTGASTGTGKEVFDTTPTLVTPVIGAATGTSLIVTGNLDGKAPITITTGGSATLGAGSFSSGYTFNQNASAAGAVTYTLPATSAGLQYCVRNSILPSGPTSETGVLTVYPAASSFVILNGVRNTVGGGGTHGVASGGAAGDSACFVAIDATDWEVYVIRGTWAAN